MDGKWCEHSKSFEYKLTGHENNGTARYLQANFCPICGAKRPEKAKGCPDCGSTQKGAHTCRKKAEPAAPKCEHDAGDRWCDYKNNPSNPFVSLKEDKPTCPSCPAVSTEPKEISKEESLLLYGFILTVINEKGMKIVDAMSFAKWALKTFVDTSAPKQPAGMRDLIEGLLYFAFDTDFYDNDPQKAIAGYLKIKAMFNDKESPWYQRRHMGDCTKECNTCMTCMVEDIEAKALRLSEQEGR